MIHDRYMELQSKMAQTAQLSHRGTCLALDELHGADGTQEEDGRNHQGMDCQPPALDGFSIDPMTYHSLIRYQKSIPKKKLLPRVYRIDYGHVALRFNML